MQRTLAVGAIEGFTTGTSHQNCPLRTVQTGEGLEESREVIRKLLNKPEKG